MDSTTAPVRNRRSMSRHRHTECRPVMLIPELHDELKAYAAREDQTLTESANLVVAIALGRFDLLPELHPQYKPAAS